MRDEHIQLKEDFDKVNESNKTSKLKNNELTIQLEQFSKELNYLKSEKEILIKKIEGFEPSLNIYFRIFGNLTIRFQIHIPKKNMVKNTSKFLMALNIISQMKLMALLKLDVTLRSTYIIRNQKHLGIKMEQGR